MKKIIIIGIIIALVIVLYFVFKEDKAIDTKSLIQKTTVTRGDIGIRIEETGEIQPKTIVAIKSLVSGKVLKLYVEENDFVRLGQLIADIEPDYNQARQISAARNELRNAEIRYKDAQKLLEEGAMAYEKHYIAGVEYERLQDNLEKAQIDLEIAQQQYSLIEDIEIKDNISKVFSTATGTIIERKIEAGEMVQSSNTSYGEGTVLLRVADLNEMIVNTSVNEVDIAKISEKQKATIRIDAFPYDTFTGTISKISATAKMENNVKVFPVQIEIDQKDRRLRPGLSANITITGDTRENILTIPIRAIFSDAQGNDVV
jgi:HlyD family secretion protein